MSDTTSSDDDHDGDDERGALAERAKRMLDRGKDVSTGMTGAIVGAAGDAVDAVQNLAGESTDTDDDAGPGSADEGIAVGTGIVAAATTEVPSGPTGGSGPVPGGADGSGSGGSGSGGSGPGGSDDEDGFIPGIGISGNNQIVLLGLIVAGLMLFGGTIWSFIGGDDSGTDDIVAPFDAASSADDTDCDDDLRDALEELMGDDGGGGLCDEVGDGTDTDDGDADQVQDETAAAAATAAPTTAEATTTTAEATTTTTEITAANEAETAPTTEAETTTTAAAPAAFTLWSVVSESDDTAQFANLSSFLGLQAALEDTSTPRTLFVPSNEAIAGVDPAALGEAGAGERIVNYHIVDGIFTAADLTALDGPLLAANDLSIDVSVVDGNVTLNGTSVVVGADRIADNGVVHVIDRVLEVPTVNEALGIENIEFEVNSAVITGAGQAELQKAVDFFTANGDARASIEGHTDTDGSAELNQTLSEDRAAAVKDFLVAAGLDADRFTTAGFGETRPILGEDGVEDKNASRRIEFILQ